MHRANAKSLRGFISVATLMLLLTVSISQTSLSQSADQEPAKECTDQIAKCDRPIKVLGDKDGCYCFACEYGKKTQKVICTNNEENIRSLTAQAIKPDS